MNEIQPAVNELSRTKSLDSVEAATEREISMFEETHGVVLPAQYKQWLLLTDGGECFPPAGVQFYGVAHKPLIDGREDGRPGEDYVVIGALATGDPILFKKGEEGVSIYNQEAGIIEDDERYDSFLAFLEDLENILGLEG